MRHQDMAHALGGTPWLIEPNAMRGYLARIEQATPEAIAAAVAAYGQRQAGPDMVGDVAVISCCGPIAYRPSWFSMYFGGTSISEMQQQFRMALADPAVRVIAFRWDSPGGSVEFVPEFAQELFDARGQKPILSVCDTMCASAAYWLASQTETIYGSASSMLGAIGVFMEHYDVSGAMNKAGVTVTQIAHGDHKLDGTQFAPLTDAAKAIFQGYVDEVGAEFDSAVARGRGVSTAIVLETFGQGQVFRGKRAIKLGLADKQGTFSQVIGKLTKGRAGAVARASVAPALAIASAIAATAKPKADDDVIDEGDDDGCETCGDDCPCDLDDCPEDCQTCDEGCACRPSAKASASSAAPDMSQADLDAIAIAIVLGAE